MRASANPDQSLDARRLGEPDCVGLALRMGRQRDCASRSAVELRMVRSRNRSRNCVVDLGIGGRYMRRASRRSRLAQAPRIPR